MLSKQTGDNVMKAWYINSFVRVQVRPQQYEFILIDDKSTSHSWEKSKGKKEKTKKKRKDKLTLITRVRVSTTCLQRRTMWLT